MDRAAPPFAQSHAHDFQAARTLMVDGQVRPNKVTDPRIIAAMRRLPRERFVPPRLAVLAYADAGVRLGQGRELTQPMVIARLVQSTAVRAGERALVVAAGAGYGAALLAACGAEVTALEDDAELLALSRTALADVAGVTMVNGPLAAGWPAAGPYDVILIDGAVTTIPPALIGQLRSPGGRLVAVRAGADGVCQAVLAEPTPGGVGVQPLFDCSAALLPALRPAPGFVF